MGIKTLCGIVIAIVIGCMGFWVVGQSSNSRAEEAAEKSISSGTIVSHEYVNAVDNLIGGTIPAKYMSEILPSEKVSELYSNETK